MLTLLLYGTIQSQDPKFPDILEHLPRFPCKNQKWQG